MLNLIKTPILFLSLLLHTAGMQAQSKHVLYYPNGQKAVEGVWQYTSTAVLPINYRDFAEPEHAYLEKMRKVVSIPDYTYYSEFNSSLLQMQCDGPVTVWYPNGNIMEQITFEHGVINGQYTAYYETGGKSMEGNMTNGMPDGLWKTFYNDGSLYYEGKFTANTQDELEYYWTSLFALKTNRYAFRQRIEYATEQFDTLDNDAARETAVMRASFNRHIPGSISKREGLFVVYGQNGLKIAEMEFTHSIRTGTWKLYDEHQKLKLELIYNSGKLMSITGQGHKKETVDQFVKRAKHEEEMMSKRTVKEPIASGTICFGREPDNITWGDELPRFEGDVQQYIKEKINVLGNARVKDIRGKYTLQFVVEKDGTLTHVYIAEGKNKRLNAELLKVVMAMPKWKPGRHNGQPRAMESKLVFSFDLVNNKW